MIHSQLSASVWAVSIVLMDAYLHIPFPPVVQEFSGFFSSWAGPSNSRSCPSASRFFPWVFTRVVATLGGHLHQLGSSSVLLFGRLASGGGVQGSFGVSSPYDPAVVSGPWVPSDLGKVFPSLHRDFLFILGLISTSQGCWLGLQSSEFWLFRSVSGSFQGSFGARPLLAEIFRPPCRLRGPCPLLQAADEASSASSSEGLHSLVRLSGLTCSLEFRNLRCCAWRGPLLLAFSKGSFLLLFPLHWSSPWTRQVRGGGGSSSPSPCVRGLVEGGGL